MKISAAPQVRSTKATSERRRAWLGLAWLGASGIGCIAPVVPDVADTDSSSDDGSSTTAADEPPSVPVGTTDREPSTTAEPTGGMAEPPACGNGLVDPGEECDGLELQGATCEALGHLPGTLACTPECTLDDSGCVPLGMVFVPSGEFEMGWDGFDFTQPVRLVKLDAFYIDETEVTVEAYAACVTAGVCNVPPVGNTFNYGVAGREKHPVNGVTWFDAEAYCGWVDGGVKRLPTEAEWEKAARGTDARMYPWGDMPEASCTHAVMDENDIHGCGTDATWPVGSMPLGASPYGALDMSGNVYEWVSDFVGYYDPADVENPTGPASGDMRVARGGAWSLEDPFYLTTIYRGGDAPIQQYAWVGIRCARSVASP